MKKIRKIATLHSIFVILMILMSFSIVGVSCSPQTVVWSDNFEDGNLDGWTIDVGDFSVANDTLQAAGGLPFSLGGDLNTIKRPSTVAYGTWSFDVQIYTTTISIAENFVVFFIMESLEGSKYGLSVMTDPSGGGPETDSPGFGLGYYPGFVLGGYAGLECYPSGLPQVFHLDITRDLDGHFNLFMDGTLVLEAMNNNYKYSNEFGFKSPDGYALDNITIDDNIAIWPNPADRANLICLQDTLDITCEPGSTGSTSFTIQNNGQASGYAILVVTPTISGFTPFFVGTEMITLMPGETREVNMGIKTDASVILDDYAFTVELWNSTSILDTLELNLTVSEKLTTTTTATTSAPSFLFMGMILAFLAVIVVQRIRKKL